MREVAKEIGVSPATLSRVEGGKLPDLLTFRKLCGWLQIDPAEVLEIPGERGPAADVAPTAAVHLRADSLLSQEAAGDLAELILAAHRELVRRARGQQEDVSAWL